MEDKKSIVVEYTIGILIFILSMLFISSLITIAYEFCMIWFIFYPILLLILCIFIGTISVLNLLFKFIKELGSMKK